MRALWASREKAYLVDHRASADARSQLVIPLEYRAPWPALTNKQRDLLKVPWRPAAARTVSAVGPELSFGNAVSDT